MMRSKIESNRISERLLMGGQWIWLILLYGIIVVALGSMISKAFFAVLLLPFLIYGIYQLAKKDKLLPEKFPYGMAWWIIFGVGSIVMIVVAYSVRVESLSWDWGKVIRSASEYVLTGNLQDKVYFARYPNNQFWYCILVVAFKIVHFIWPTAVLEQFYLVSIALGSSMVASTIALLHHIAGLLWNQRCAFAVGLMAWFCVPLYMWAMYAYTDTAGMLVFMVLLYLFIKARRCEKVWEYIVYLCLFGFAAAIAFALKVTVFIFVIACVIALVLQGESWKKFLIGLLLIGIFFGFGKGVTGAIVNHFIPLEDEFCDQYEFPLTHWIMMSLDYGGYRQEDVDFTQQFPSYEKKKEANLREIKKRLNKRNVLGNMQFFFYDKQNRTWGDSTFSGCDYLSREPQNPDGFLERFVTTEGDLNWIIVVYSTLYYALLLVGLLISALCAVKKKGRKNPLFVGRLAMIGIALFMTIWECNSRYLVVFLPLMILLSGEGYFGLRSYCKDKKEDVQN